MSDDRHESTLKAVLTLWLNNYLRIENITLKDIFTDFQDGKTLPLLAELLYEEKFKWNKKPTFPAHKLNNNEAAILFLKQKGALPTQFQIAPEDFTKNKPENQKKVLIFFTLLINNYSIEPIRYKDKVGKNALKQWCQDHSDDYDISNWGSAWDNGKASFAIIHHFYPNAIGNESVTNQQLLQFTDQANEPSNDENVNVIVASEFFYFFEDYRENLNPESKIQNLLMKRGNSFIWSHIKSKEIAFREPEMIQASKKKIEIVDKKERAVGYTPNINDVCRKLNAIGPDRVVLITLIGSYQTGKSSMIKRMTRFSGVKIGNGKDDETKGAVLYGPFSYNKIRSEFKLERVPEDLNVMFVDTEGANGFFQKNSFEAATNLIVNLLTPFTAMSDIIISLNKSNITQAETETVTEVIKAIKSLRNDWENIYLVNSFTNYPDYDPINKPNEIESIFQNAADDSTKKFPQIQFSETIPLVQYDIKNTKKDIFAQDESFQKGFAIFASKIINLIEKRKDKFIVDGTSMAKLFTSFASNEIVKDFAAIAQEIQQTREKSMSLTYQRVYERTCKKIITEEISQINKLYEEYEQNLKDGKEVSKLDFHIEERTQRVISLLNEKIPETFHDLNFFKMYENSIKERLQSFADATLKNDIVNLNYLEEKYIIDLVDSYVGKVYNRISADMNSTKAQTFKGVYDENVPELITKAIEKEFLRIRKSYSFNLNVVAKVETKFKGVTKIYIEKIRTEADAIAKLNRNEAGFWNRICHDIKKFFCGEKIKESILSLEDLSYEKLK